MVLENIRNKISRYFDDLDSLEDVEDMYDECIKSIEDRGFGTNGIIGWINYYKKDIDNLKSEFRSRGPKFKATSVHSATEDAPPLVRDVYSDYKSKNPLLKGNETHVSMGSRGDDKRRFKRKAEQHIDFLRELKSELRKAKQDLDGAYRKRSQKKAEKQRGETVEFNMYEAMETTPTELEEKFSKILEESLESDIESNDTEKEEENKEEPNIMFPYQLVFFLAKKLNDEREDELYRQLKAAHKEQARKIESNIHTIGDLDRYRGELNGFLRIDDEDVQYIRKYVSQDEILQTPEQYRERKNK
jgi:hypothetical protein